MANIKAFNRWTGAKVEAFIIGGMTPPAWFENMLESGDALISDEEDIWGKSAVPFVGDFGQAMVLLMATDTSDVQRGVFGDWVVRFSDYEVATFTKNQFASTFIITDRGIE